MGAQTKLPADVIKYAPSGQITAVLPPNTGFVRASVAHGLPYVPYVLGAIPVGGGNYLPTPFLQFSSTGVNIEHTRLEADDTYVYMLIYAPNVAESSYSTGFTRVAQYYLLQQPAV